MEPRVGVEPTTCRLRIDCSTTELPRPCFMTIAFAEKHCQFIGGWNVRCEIQREKGNMAQPMPMPTARKRNSDQRMYLMRSLGRRRPRKPKATEMTTAKRRKAWK